jgi:hypothetical protein
MVLGWLFLRASCLLAGLLGGPVARQPRLVGLLGGQVARQSRLVVLFGSPASLDCSADICSVDRSAWRAVPGGLLDLTAELFGRRTT